MKTTTKTYMSLMAQCIALLKELAIADDQSDDASDTLRSYRSLSNRASTLLDEYNATVRDTLNTEIIPHADYLVLSETYSQAAEWAADEEISKGKWVYIRSSDALKYAKHGATIVVHPSVFNSDTEIPDEELTAVLKETVSGRFKRIMI